MMMNRLPEPDEAAIELFAMMEYHRPVAYDHAMTRRILVVEDEHAIADVIRRSLAECDLVVEVVHDGEQGLGRAMSGEHALVILDLILPRLDGLSICRCLRANGLSVPILILTGLGATVGIEAASLHGADALMLKPFDLHLLQERVGELIGEGTAMTPDVGIGALLLNMAKRTLTLDDVIIPLSALEFSLLELLVRYRGRVMTYRLMGQHLWGSTSISPLVIDILINAIEIKSEGGIAIECIPDVGYRLG
jgi:two-component system copper resistance phosphate regulon response regulator CusR